MDPNPGTASPYRGPSGALRDSPWLTAEDLPDDKDTVVVIDDVLLRKDVVFQGGRKRPSMGTLKIRGLARELGLNATNRKRLVAMFGGNTAAWIGKSISLYVDPNVTMAGETVRAVRIRNIKPEGK